MFKHLFRHELTRKYLYKIGSFAAVHCILYDDVLVLLQKQDDRYVLCCHGSHSTGGLQEPFISMQRAHVSTVAYGNYTCGFTKKAKKC